MLPTQPLSPTLSGSPRRHMGRRKAVVMLATACALAILLVYEGVAFSRRLEEQRVAAVRPSCLLEHEHALAHRSFVWSCQAKAALRERCCA